MRILVLTAYSDLWRSIGRITAPRWQTYASSKGYDFCCIRHYSREFGPPPFQKLRYIRNYLGVCDALFVVDADCYCTNLDFSLETLADSHAEDILASRDWNQSPLWSTAAMLIRNTVVSARIFNEALKKPCIEGYGCYDQTAMHAVIKQQSEFSNHIHILPRRIFNSVPEECGFPDLQEPWRPGDFLVHATGLDSVEKRVWILKKYAVAQSVSDLTPPA